MPKGAAKRALTEERMDCTGSVIVDLAGSVTVLAFPISLGGLVGLKLRQFPLQAPLYFFAFFQGEAKIIETGHIDNPFDVGNLATLQNAVHPNKLYRDDHLQLRCHEWPFHKRHPIT